MFLRHVALIFQTALYSDLIELFEKRDLRDFENVLGCNTWKKSGTKMIDSSYFVNHT